MPKTTDAVDPICTNRNVNWMNSPHFWIFYCLMVLAVRAWMPFFVPEDHAWTGTSVIHGVVSRLFFQPPSRYYAQMPSTNVDIIFNHALV